VWVTIDVIGRREKVRFKAGLESDKIDQDNLRTKCSALNVDFNGVRFDLLG